MGLPGRPAGCRECGGACEPSRLCGARSFFGGYGGGRRSQARSRRAGARKSEARTIAAPRHRVCHRLRPRHPGRELSHGAVRRDNGRWADLGEVDCTGTAHISFLPIASVRGMAIHPAAHPLSRSFHQAEIQQLSDLLTYYTRHRWRDDALASPKNRCRCEVSIDDPVTTCGVSGEMRRTAPSEFACL